VTSNALEAIESVRAAARIAATAGELPAFLAELERVRAEALLEAVSPAPAQTPAAAGRVLTVEQAAARLGRSRWWIYRNKAVLPFIVRFGTGGYGISEDGLDRWIRRRTASP
jgi:predicted DNA-binding transcriptional regulator AlpA